MSFVNLRSLDIPSLRDFFGQGSENDMGWFEEFQVRPEIKTWVYKLVSENKFARNMFYDPVQYNRSMKFLSDLEQVIRNGQNVQCAFAGKTGSGKSYSAIRTAFNLSRICRKIGKKMKSDPAYQTDPMFKKRIDGLIASQVRLGFGLQETSKLLKVSDYGDIVVQDERIRPQGKGSRLEAEKRKAVEKTVRAKQINIIYCQPDVEKSSTLNWNLLALGFHIELELSLLLLYEQIPGTSDPTKSELILTGLIFLQREENEDFFKWYEGKKMEYIDKLLATGGGEMIGADAEELDQRLAEVIQFIKAKGFNPSGRGQWETAIKASGVEIGDSYELDDLLNWMDLKKTQSVAKEDTDELSESIEIIENLQEIGKDPIEEYKTNLEKIIRRLYSKTDIVSTAQTRDILLDIYVKKISNVDTAEKFGLSEGRISQIKNDRRIVGAISKTKGKMFEEYLAAYYEAKEEVKEIHLDGAKSKPDLIVNYKNGDIEIISIKHTDSGRTYVKPIYKQDGDIKGDCLPEIIHWNKVQGKKHSNIRLYLEFFNERLKIHRKIELHEKNLDDVSSTGIPLFA